MPRPQRTIVSDNPEIASFAEALRSLRGRTDLTLQQLSERAHYSVSALSEATNGRKLPTWELTRNFVAACGGDVAEWSVRWRHAAKQLPEPLDRSVHRPSPRSREHAAGESPPARVLYNGHELILPVKIVSLALLTFALVAMVLFVASQRSDAAPSTKARPVIGGQVLGRVTSAAGSQSSVLGVLLGAGTVLAGGVGVLSAAAVARAASAPRLLTCRFVGGAEPWRDTAQDVHTEHASWVAAHRATEPRIVKIKVINRGRRDIPSRAFDQQRPLRLDVAVPVLGILDVRSMPAGYLTPRIEADGTAVNLGPDLIKIRQAITLRVLVDGAHPRLTTPEPSIIDTRIRQVSTRRPAHGVMAAFTIAATGLTAGVMLGSLLGP